MAFGGSFGSTAPSAFGQAQPQMTGMTGNGTAIAKYQPHSGTDTLVKNGQSNSVNTRQHCITAMKEYENKSLEELRIEDYTANRKGPQAGSVPSGGLFGSTPQNTSLFGAPVSQPQSTGLFGAQPATSSIGGFATAANSFGQPQQPASAFGQTQQSGIFGKPNNAFSMTPSFGQNQQPQQPAGSLFSGAKPFGTPATSATTGFTGFATSTASATTPFGVAKPFGQPSTGLFGTTAPVSQAPPFGATAAPFGGGFGATGFGQTSTASAQPVQGTSLFGLNSAAPAASGKHT